MEWFEELIKGKWTEKFAKAIEEKGYKIANKQDNWRRSTINIVLPDDSCQSLYLDCSIAKSDVSIWIRKGWLKEEDIKELVMLADILKMTIKEEMETNPKLKLLYVTGMINLEEKTLFS